MKASISLCIALLCALPAAAEEGSQYHLLESNPLNFAAQVVNSRTNVTEASLGTIVYDSNSAAFYGLAPASGTGSGTWIQLGGTATSGPSNVSSNGTSNYHVEAARIAAPASGSCAINSQTGSWIASTPTSSLTGQCTISITAGEFTATPSCVCSNESGNNRICNISAASDTSLTTLTLIMNPSSNATEDDPIAIICMGPG